jgi:hypothetical protein
VHRSAVSEIEIRVAIPQRHDLSPLELLDHRERAQPRLRELERVRTNPVETRQRTRHRSAHRLRLQALPQPIELASASLELALQPPSLVRRVLRGLSRLLGLRRGRRRALELRTQRREFPLKPRALTREDPVELFLGELSWRLWCLRRLRGH